MCKCRPPVRISTHTSASLLDPTDLHTYDCHFHFPAIVYPTILLSLSAEVLLTLRACLPRSIHAQASCFFLTLVHTRLQVRIQELRQASVLLAAAPGLDIGELDSCLAGEHSEDRQPNKAKDNGLMLMDWPIHKEQLAEGLWGALGPLAPRVPGIELYNLDLDGFRMPDSAVVAMGRVLGPHTHTLCLPASNNGTVKLWKDILAAFPHLAVLQTSGGHENLIKGYRSLAAACKSVKRCLKVHMEKSLGPVNVS